MDPYYANSYIVKLPTVTADTTRLIAAAEFAVERIYRRGYRYAKAGVMLFDIQSSRAVQRSFFDEVDSEKVCELMRTVDNINAAFGKRTVFFGATGVSKKTNLWMMKRQNVTPSYTTDWDHLPQVR